MNYKGQPWLNVYAAQISRMHFFRGADIEVKDRDNFTPLLLAACYGHAKAVELLISSGADILAEDKNERTALFLAAEEDRLEVLKVRNNNTNKIKKLGF